MKKNDIIERLKIPDFVQATKNQLVKEFSLVDLELTLQENTIEKNEILFDLSQEIEVLLRDNPERLAQLFYRMDLPESKTNDIIAHAENIAFSLAEIMLVRCAQKVYLRTVFS